jgi:hypothetical protein
VKRLWLLAIGTGVLLICGLQPAPAVVDLRSRIDGTSVYTGPSDSLKFVGATHYDGFSDIVSIAGANIISVDFFLTRNGKAVANCVIRLEGSKDGVNFVNLHDLGDSILITSTGVTTITFPYATIFNYYRLMVHNDTLFSAITKWKVGGRTNAQ